MMHRLTAIWCFSLCSKWCCSLWSQWCDVCPYVPAGTHHSLQRTSLGEAVIICRRQTSFKKRIFVSRQKCVFCWLRAKFKSPLRPTKIRTTRKEWFCVQFRVARYSPPAKISTLYALQASLQISKRDMWTYSTCLRLRAKFKSPLRPTTKKTPRLESPFCWQG